jgi:hypothetical protein
MNALFKEYKDSGKISEALLVGRNMVNKEPGNSENVEAYVEFLFYLAEALPSLDERKEFVGQANVTISFFEENADLTEETISKIKEYRERLESIASKIDALEDERAADDLKKLEVENSRQIKELYTMKQKLANVKQQEDFDKILQEISLIDARIEHDYLTEEQKNHYDQLNRDCTETISAKMRELEYIKNVNYNKEAVDAYDKAFQNFKSDEAKYKNQSQLFQLVSSTLFAFDAGRLFNETLIFYNHVYSYIFGKLDDDGKLALTRYSIECERRLR